MTTKKVTKPQPRQFESQKVSQKVHGGGSYRVVGGKPVKQEPPKPKTDSAD